MTIATHPADGGAPAPGKACGTCTMCCKVLHIAALDKPHGVWCPHVKQGRGCGIYADRPQECRKFHCGYLSSNLSEDWFPAKSKIVLMADASGGITAVVDHSRPDAWKEKPFYAQLKAWARELLPQQKYVVVRVGKRAIAVLPDEDFDLGAMEMHAPMVIEVAAGPAGKPIYRARRADPGYAARLAA
ncbi:MAG: hypothetical protein FJX64_07390, partial [Alphaproteobacteria bacterium]|nr:hypothetical protein [Alphaproteobacteria bacterium]